MKPILKSCWQVCLQPRCWYQRRAAAAATAAAQPGIQTESSRLQKAARRNRERPAQKSPAGDSGLTYDGDEVTITYWHTHGDSEEVVLKEQIVPEFEKQFPKIHVKLVRMPYDGLKQQVIQGVSSGTAPRFDAYGHYLGSRVCQDGRFDGSG